MKKIIVSPDDVFLVKWGNVTLLQASFGQLVMLRCLEKEVMPKEVEMYVQSLEALDWSED